MNDINAIHNQLNWEICPSCDGSGSYDVYYNEYDIYTEDCPTCEGCGEIAVE